MINSSSAKNDAGSFDDLFAPNALESPKIKSDIIEVSLSEIDSFQNHPFKVINDEAMAELAQSIKDNGLITPAIVRKKDDGRYELISGHRRKMACELAGLSTMSVTVRELDKDASIVTMVDSNMQRENILPSEKAFSYKMKLEAIKRQPGRPKNNSRQVVGNYESADLIGSNNESGRQVQRYIRLTELIPPLLEMVDNKKIAFGPACEISYLNKKEQKDLLFIIESEEATPSLSQAQRLKDLSQEGMLDKDKLFAIMKEGKANQQEQIRFKKDTIEKFFPESYTSQQIEETILTLLEQWQRNRERNREAR